ncbi:peptidylprolyl isomerase [Corynebacterium gerontici]|nr:peptidylprolyl isomerase [Corynebacterium gerontici]
MQKLEKEVTSRERQQKRRPWLIGGGSALALLLVAGLGYAGVQHFGEDETTTEAASTSTETPSIEPLALERSDALPDTVQCNYPDAGDAAKPVDKPATKDISTKGTVKVTLDTTAGKIPLELDRSVSPCTVNAITHLAKSGFYNDTVCHRLVTQGLHILQCGDPTGQGTGGPGFSFANEYPTDEAKDQQQPVNYPRGTIAMANSGADTNGSQFFLNYGDSPLPPSYTYFGKIGDEGLKTLDNVAAQGVEGGGSEGAPATEVKINKASVN